MVMVSLGVRGIERGFPVPSSTLVSHQRIAAYVEPMRRLEAIGFAGPEADARQVREVADYWIGLHRAGLLQEMPASTIFDSARDGVRKQVLNGRERLVARLIGMASKGGPGSGADLRRAFNLSRIARESDFVSISQSVSGETRAFRVLDLVAESLSADERRGLAEDLSRAPFELAPLAKLFRQSRALVKEYRQIYAPDEPAVEDLPMLERFTEVLKEPGRADQLHQMQAQFGGTESNLLIAMNLARHCYLQTAQLEAARRRALLRLAPLDQAKKALAADQDGELCVAQLGTGSVGDRARKGPSRPSG